MSFRPDRALSRRRFLRGAGALLALPALESLAPRVAMAAATQAGVTASGAPLRMAFFAIPNGVNMDKWRPEGVGPDFAFSQTLSPLESLKSKLQIFTGFEVDGAAAHGDGPGDHARTNAAFLTGVHPLKTAGANIRNGISVDQVAAQQVGHLTRLASLELGTESSRRSGFCDNGYSCAYQYNLSWASSVLPMPPEPDPRQVFERLFGSGSGSDRERNFLQRQHERRSLIDFVMEDARSLTKELGANDRHKLDEYLAGVRSVEAQIEKAERFKLPEPGMDRPSGMPATHGEHVRLMLDLSLLAFQTDSTRIITFPFAHEGSNRTFQEIGISEGHHSLSHHQRKEKNLEQIAQIDKFYVEQLAYFLKKLDEIKDLDGKTALDNSMIVYGSGIGDGDRHNHDDLPVLVAGGGGGTFKTGRHVKFNEDVPMTNLYLAMLERMGVQAQKLGDSTGKLLDI
ncbi:hypothetical protein AYO47_00925 [Planctomyces sp. SCGC AG-212-M04]|nr:hypothetical protein AYO47_00925 [Planctomyces sp. SCGC AG-212-M04]